MNAQTKKVPVGVSAPARDTGKNTGSVYPNQTEKSIQQEEKPMLAASRETLQIVVYLIASIFGIAYAWWIITFATYIIREMRWWRK